MKTGNREKRKMSKSAPCTSTDALGVALPASNPLGEVAPQERAPAGFRPQDLLATAADAVPAWQRDTGAALGQSQAASVERASILSAFTRLGRFGVILDEESKVIQGNPGWTGHLSTIPSLSVTGNTLVATSPASQKELLAVLGLLFSDYNWASVPVALRDLDGWVMDIVHIKRVGPANPNRAYVILPKSPVEVANSVSKLGLALALTARETSMVHLIIKGESNREMATTLKLKQSEIKRAMTQLVGKFRVRQKSDIVRVLASFL